MSLFAHNQGFQIHGGNFYNVAGGLNIECPLPLPVTGDPAHSAGVQEDWGLDGTTAPSPIGIPHSPTSGVHRNTQERSGARHHPYSTSGRPQIDWHPPEPAELPEERMSEQINDVGLWETENTPSPSGTLISVEKAMNLSREIGREIPRKSAGIGYLLNSVSDSRLDAASSLRNNGVRCDSSEPPERIDEATGLGSTRGPVRHSYESVPPPHPSLQLGPYEMTTTITGGTFVSNNIHRGERGIDLLHSAVALAAIYDSAESFPQPKCHPETRMKMLENLRQWSLETDPRSAILWLHGPAGAGKSAIMQTLARELQNGETRRLLLFQKGACHLALGISWLKAPISNTVEDDPSIIARSIEIQLQKLISEPCHLHNVGGTWDPITVVIDGLDECEGQDVQEEILCAVRNCTAEYNLPFRFIIASRPEPHISDIFQSPFYEGCYKSFNVVQSFDDVRKYLRDEFARIHREHRNTMANIPLPWPSPDVLEQLVWESSGHFIYASTIIKFVNDKNYRPTERLAIVQQQDIVQSCSAFDPIDQLYMIILCSSPRQAQLIPILCAIVNFSLAPDIIDQLCGLAPGDTRLLLRGLHSVLKLPEDLDDDDFPTILTHHASFVDFLKNQRRSQQFYVDGLHHRMDLARAFLKLCAGQYRSLNYAEKDFIPLLISLPPSTELLAPIQVTST
ncbi:hypothetical protein K438DRAFT_1991735 [Mycena galopus ATCC 62051]|nr:hypothetical protein K438DRAFT_1991735 [Mycena galopus ATCC 62051]